MNQKERAQQIADEFNQKYQIGTPVIFWPWAKEGEGQKSKTRSPAWVVCGDACVSCEGYAGGIALTHVEIIKNTNT